MIENKNVLAVAAEVFEKFDLPDGAYIDGLYGRVRIAYVYIDGNGLEEMRQILRSVEGSWLSGRLYSSAGRVVIEASIDVLGIPTEIYAQMEVIDPEAKPRPSAVEKLIEEIRQ